MFETRLIEIYNSFDTEEKRRLRKWINSDFVNKNDSILQFFGFIDSRKSITAKTVSKQKAHAYMYPDVPYNDLKIRHLIWLTTEIFEQFIVYDNIGKELALREQLLSKFYARKDLYKYALKNIENGIALIQKSKVKNAKHYNMLFNLHSDYYDINSRNIRTHDFNIDDVVSTFTVFVILETLKSASRIASIQKVGDTKTAQLLLPGVLDIVKNSDYLSLPEIRIYYNIYLITVQEDEKAFAQFMADIKKFENLFSVHNLNELYRLAINFCIKRSNQNNKFYTQQAFDLYIYTIDKKILLENNEISRFIFTNTVTLGIKLKEFTRIQTFIDRYSKFIDKEFRQTTIDFNSAKLFYAKGNADKALKILLTNEFQDVIWNLNSKYLVLKILFEARDFELFKAHLKAFRVYINRKSSIGYHKTYFTNVIKSLSQLQRIYLHPQKYKNFQFADDTPDVDWFNSALKKIKK